MTSKHDKEQMKDLKYYWDNRYSYLQKRYHKIITFLKCNWYLFMSSRFMKKYIYLLISTCIFFLIVYTKYTSLIEASNYQPLYEMKLNEFVLFFCFSIPLFFCFFVFLFFCFSKKKAFQITALTGFIIVILSFVWSLNAWLWETTPRDIFFWGKIFYDIIMSYNVIYLESLIFALSLNGIIFYFIKEKSLKKDEYTELSKFYFIIFLTFLLLFPYFIYIFTGTHL